MHPSPFGPGGVATARIHNRRGLLGFAVIQDYEQSVAGTVNHEGHGVLLWDADAKCYYFHWFNSHAAAETEYKGQFNGDQLVLTSQSEQGYSRAIFTFSGAGSYQFRLDVSPNGVEWQPFMEGNYRKLND